MSTSVVILAVPISASNALDVLIDLSRNHLVEPVVLLDTKGGNAELRDGEKVPVDLDRYLAVRKLDTVRMVSLTLCADGAVHRLDGDADLARQLRKRCSKVGIAFQAISVVVPDEETLAPADAFHPDWEANLVVAPEDAAGTKGMASVGLTAERVPYVAVSAALTLGGAWSWQSEPPLAAEKAQFIQGERRASVVRLVVRLVDAGDLTSQVVGWALDPAGIWPIPVNTTAHGAPEGVVAELADQIAAAREVGFGYRPPAQSARPRPKRIGLVTALGLFFRRLWAHLRALPARKWASAKEAAFRQVESFAQSQTFGRDSEIAISMRTSPTSLDEVVDGTARLQNLANLPSLSIPAPASTPDTWSTVRSVTFGLVDGTEFIGSLRGREPQWHQQRAVVEKRTLVVAPYEGTTGGFRLTPDDAELLSVSTSSSETEAPAIGSADVSSARLFNGLLSEAERKAAERQRSKPLPPPKLDDDNNDEFDEDEIDEHEASEVDLRVERLAELRSRFNAWTDDRKDTLMWKLGEHLDHSLQQAVDVFTSSEAELRALIEEMAGYDEAERNLLRRLRIRTIIFAVLLVAILAGVAVTFIMFPLATGLMALGALLVGLLLVAVGFLSTARQEVQLEHRLKELRDRPTELMEARQQSAGEVARLIHLNQQLSDWSDIYSHIIHHPWGRSPEIEPAKGWSTPTEILSLAAGNPEINPDQLHGVILQLRRQICGPRWLSQNFLDVVQLWRERYGQMAAVGDGESVGPEADPATTRRPISSIPGTGEALYSPRLQFLRELVRGRYSDQLRQERVDELSELLAAIDASNLLQVVHCDVPGLDALPPREFLGGIVRFSPLPGFEDYFRPTLPPVPTEVSQSVVALSEAVPVEIPQDGTPRQRVGVNDVAERFVLAAFRLDLSEKTMIDNITLVESSNDDGQPAPMSGTSGVGDLPL